MLNTILLVLFIVVMIFGCCRGMFRSGHKGGSCGMSHKPDDAGKSEDKQTNDDENNPDKKSHKGGCC